MCPDNGKHGLRARLHRVTGTPLEQCFLRSRHLMTDRRGRELLSSSTGLLLAEIAHQIYHISKVLRSLVTIQDRNSILIINDLSVKIEQIRLSSQVITRIAFPHHLLRPFPRQSELISTSFAHRTTFIFPPVILITCRSLTRSDRLPSGSPVLEPKPRPCKQVGTLDAQPLRHHPSSLPSILFGFHIYFCLLHYTQIHLSLAFRLYHKHRTFPALSI